MKCHRSFLGLSTSKLAVLYLSLVIGSSVQAELILTAPPRETAEQGARDYGPLAAHLATVIGEKVTYKHPGTWPRYQRDMRADKFDIVFDGPHFISWRMMKHGHLPLVRLPGKLSFVMVVKSDDKENNKLLDLTYDSICAIPPPNLSTLTMITAFGAIEPARLKTVKGGMSSVYQAFKKGECRAAILRDEYYQTRLTDEERAATKVIYKSEPVINQGLTVSPRVKKELHEKIIVSLLDADSAVSPILKRFAPGEDIMIPATSEDYAEYYTLLRGVIVGW